VFERGCQQSEVRAEQTVSPAKALAQRLV
jgi:hypothetical protein